MKINYIFVAIILFLSLVQIGFGVYPLVEPDVALFTLGHLALIISGGIVLILSIFEAMQLARIERGSK